MSSVTPIDPPLDYSQRVKRARGVRGLTQAQLAELIGVSDASVNRWENGYSRPNNLPWRRILEIERSIDGDAIGDELPAVTVRTVRIAGPGLLRQPGCCLGPCRSPSARLWASIQSGIRERNGPHRSTAPSAAGRIQAYASAAVTSPTSLPFGNDCYALC